MRTVDISHYGGPDHMSSFRKYAQVCPLYPLRVEKRRIFIQAERSGRLPFFPGVPVPAIKLRAHPRPRRLPYLGKQLRIMRGWAKGVLLSWVV